MAPSRRLLVTALALAAGAAGCGTSAEQPRPYRIGVVSDCMGILRAHGDEELAGAQLPLLRRGARARGRTPQDGVSAVTIAGRRVDLVQGCTESLEFSTLGLEVRRLVENEHVDALVAGAIGADEIVLRRLAARYPGVTVIPAAHGPREVTLRGRPPNLYRVGADESQGAAGLGTHAFRRLGWRRAAVLYLDWDAGWGARDVFVREFCALGGRARQVASATFDPADVRRVPRDVDGVVVLSAPPFDPAVIVRALRRRTGDPRSLLLGPGVTGDREAIGNAGAAVDGVAGTATLPPLGTSPGRRTYRHAFARAFPGLPASAADSDYAVTFHNAVEALLLALDRAGGRAAGVGPALGRLDADLAGVRTRIDGNGQAVVPISLVRIERAGGDTPRVRLLRSLPAVDESAGGTLEPRSVPDSRPARCARRAR